MAEKRRHVSVSSLKKFNKCPRDFVMQKMFPNGIRKSAFAFGSAYHEFNENFYGRDKSFGESVDLSKKYLFKNFRPALREEVKEKLVGKPEVVINTQVKKKYEDAEIMLEQMIFRFKKLVDEIGFKYIEVEQDIRLNLGDFDFLCYIDGVVELDGDLYLLELKTAKSIAKQHLPIDTQLTAYLWAYEKKFGIIPKGVIWISNGKKKSNVPKLINKDKDVSASMTEAKKCHSEDYLKKCIEVYETFDKIPEKQMKTYEELRVENDKSFLDYEIITRTDSQIKRFEEVLDEKGADLYYCYEMMEYEQADSLLYHKCIPDQFCMTMCDSKEKCIELEQDPEKFVNSVGLYLNKKEEERKIKEEKEKKDESKN